MFDCAQTGKINDIRAVDQLFELPLEEQPQGHRLVVAVVDPVAAVTGYLVLFAEVVGGYERNRRTFFFPSELDGSQQLSCTHTDFTDAGYVNSSRE